MSESPDVSNGSLTIPKWFLVINSLLVLPTIGGGIVWAYRVQKDVSAIAVSSVESNKRMDRIDDRIERIEDRIFQGVVK